MLSENITKSISFFTVQVFFHNILQIQIILRAPWRITGAAVRSSGFRKFGPRMIQPVHASLNQRFTQIHTHTNNKMLDFFYR